MKKGRNNHALIILSFQTVTCLIHNGTFPGAYKGAQKMCPPPYTNALVRPYTYTVYTLRVTY